MGQFRSDGNDDLAYLRIGLHVAVSFDDLRKRKRPIDDRLEVTGAQIPAGIL
jgi:hypothetical protein